MDESLLNETLQRLSASINQQAAASINSISLPEFSGLPNEDIYDFIERFKLATLTLSDGYRCLALVKALKGAAVIWAKANVKNLIADAKWNEIKLALYKRFGHPDKVLRNKEKLAKLQFVEGTSTLISYVELYSTAYKKAFREHSETDVIQSLRLNLPDRIIKGLNHLNDSWSDLTTLKELFQIIERYETKIMPYEQRNETTGGSLTKEALQVMFKEFRDVIKEDIKNQKDKRNEDADAKGLALVAHSSHNPPKHNPMRYNHQTERNYFRGNDYKRPRMDKRYQFNRVQPQPHQANRQAIQDNVRNADQDKRDPKGYRSAYYHKFGKPPGPCYYCNGDHFNKHCPLKLDDLK